MKNRTVLVVGGSTGINLSIAQAFNRAGDRVCIVSRSAEKIAAGLELLDQASGEVMGLQADVRHFDQVSHAVEKTYERWGDIDVLISGAAGNFISPAETLSANGFKTIVDIDLNGCFNVMRACFPRLRKPGSSIINITAPHATEPTINQIHVCAAKAGINQVTKTAAMEWGRHGIRVNAISPGPIQGTEGMSRLSPTTASDTRWLDSIPLGRWGNPADIADAAQWLSSCSASFVTGVVLPVDGGWTLGGSAAMTSAMNA
ncbi:SDR family oxidoreductase [uncultured Zhongshania sp.]|uniref:SDR family oxidoreductase n=1 Tax=uncultured Zhongshania sp. TaxID=1642288 RepID=UPI0030D7B612|tara:strand:- start:103 stop:879 length:777 start_codon:yes stop_codon:yes gene_type:complete